ncbi:NAD-dependent epimerase/dehydratase family protein [Paractinoplanes lichenicola]|uniref:NAD-dependent epimerase/dehydratase family protein n=1 Tax=Paractinoplanes lichenicola TaxID=2802976 RepID=A0ABS1VEK2_9ACTN|nr:NAD-dependent epimerase/dehydratase family protein [Actinoplanes lichenicola]MBL7253120.1 NAD-dependent epimerase/dehydratase family protein [Actinoplanes lichenicola]
MNDTTAPILVTGATGHLGGHSLVRLLTEGYSVRAVVRRPEQEHEVRARLAFDPGERLEFRTAELTDDAHWDEALAGVRYVWHHASPFPATQPRDADELIVPARDGALRVLAAGRAAGVRRVILTSSYAAVGYSAKPGGRYDENDWTNPDDDLPPYIRSKTVAERAAWDYVADQPGLELAVINPTGIFGPVLDHKLSASIGLVKAMLEGSMPVVPRQYFGVVDVRDVVDLHLRAMLNPAAAGQRFIAVSGRPISYAGLSRLLPGAPPVTEQPGEPPQLPEISNEKARRILGWQPRDVATTIADTVESLQKALTTS